MADLLNSECNMPVDLAEGDYSTQGTIVQQCWRILLCLLFNDQRNTDAVASIEPTINCA